MASESDGRVSQVSPAHRADLFIWLVSLRTELGQLALAMVQARIMGENGNLGLSAALCARYNGCCAALARLEPSRKIGFS